MYLFLRPKDDFSWIVPGYINPNENAFFAVAGDSPVIFLEDIVKDPSLIGKITKVLALSLIPILQLGQVMWDKIIKEGIPVYGSSLTVPLLSLFLNPKTLTVSEEDHVSVAERENLFYNQFRADIVVSYSSLLRNSSVFQEYLVFKVLLMNFMSYVPENVNIITSSGWSENRKFFFGDLSSFDSSFLSSVKEHSRGIKHMAVYISVESLKDVDRILDTYFKVMDSVKSTLRLSLSFYPNGRLSNLPEISYFQRYKLMGVKLKISEDFHFRVRSHFDALVSSGKFLNSSFINKTKLIKG